MPPAKALWELRGSASKNYANNEEDNGPACGWMRGIQKSAIKTINLRHAIVLIFAGWTALLPVPMTS